MLSNSIARKLKSLHQASPPLRAQTSSSELETQNPTEDRFTLSEQAKDQTSTNFWQQSALLASAAISGFSALSGGSAQAAAPAQLETVMATEQKTAQEKPATLILSDYFDQRTGDAHGKVVEQSARELGFSGNIITKEAPENEAVKSSHRFFSRLDNRQFSPEEMRSFTYDFMLDRQVGSLDSATEALKDLPDTQNSVLNLSRGYGKAQIMDELYSRVRMAWDTTEHPQSQVAGQRRLAKLAPALGMDAESIMKGSTAERGEFQKRLLGLLDEVGQDKTLAQSQARYDQAVTEFESRNNSVVVAAANSGEVLHLMGVDAPTPELAPDFFLNRLANKETTMVGATRRSGEQEQVAAYSNPDPGVDIYADGDIGPAHGTSFATPRVAAVMARLHAQNPQASSQEVETMAAQQFGETLANYGKAAVAPALKESAAQDWFSVKPEQLRK